MQEIPILGISFLDEDAQSYTGEEGMTETGKSLCRGGEGEWAGTQAQYLIYSFQLHCHYIIWLFTYSLNKLYQIQIWAIWNWEYLSGHTISEYALITRGKVDNQILWNYDRIESIHDILELIRNT